jgi:hypothetical protein
MEKNNKNLDDVLERNVLVDVVRIEQTESLA